MATSKPISSISYNTLDFLLDKLNEWYSEHLIQAWQLIQHKGEDGDKDHIHFRIEPNCRLDPMRLQEELLQFTKDSKKPLGCRTFRPSKEEDWFLYVVHDKQYLKLKYNGENNGEKIEYNYTDIMVSQYYDLDVAFLRAKISLKHTGSNIAKRISTGENPLNLVLEGENPSTVNGILQIMKETDYTRIARNYKELEEKFNLLCTALDNYGLIFINDDKGGHLE